MKDMAAGIIVPVGGREAVPVSRMIVRITPYNYDRGRTGGFVTSDGFDLRRPRVRTKDYVLAIFARVRFRTLYGSRVILPV